MKEDVHVRQIHGDRKRRWFTSPDFDLIIWLNGDETFAGFELCYDKPRIERSIAWRPKVGFAHATVDDGEHRPGRYKATPVLAPEIHLDAHRIYSAFLKESHSLPSDIANYVLQTLQKHPSFCTAP